MALVELWRETGERALPRPRRAPDRPARARAARARAASGRRTGRTTCRCARRRPSPATPSASCTSTPGRSTSPSRPATRPLLDAVDRAAGRHGRDPCLPDRRAREPPSRRGVRRPVRAAARPGVRRDLRGDRQRDARLAPAARDRRGALRRPDRADRLQRRAVAACRSTGRTSSTSTRSSGGASRSATTHGDGARQPWYPCACCPPNLMRLLASLGAVPRDRGRRRRPDPPVRDGRDRGDGRRRHGPARRRDRTTRGPDASWCGSSRRRARPWTLSLRVPPGVDRRRPVAVNGGDGDRRRTASSTGSTWAGGRRRDRPRPRAASDRHAVRPRVDATRGCVVARARADRLRDRDGGPARRPASSRTSRSTRRPARRPSRATTSRRGSSGWRMPARSSAARARRRRRDPLELRAIPYFAWANRRVGGDAGLDPGRRGAGDDGGPGD